MIWEGNVKTKAKMADFGFENKYLEDVMVILVKEIVNQMVAALSGKVGESALSQYSKQFSIHGSDIAEEKV